MTTPSNESIIHFVMKTLGCNCPEEVFKQIDFSRLFPDDDSPHARILIGGRLLVYIYEIEDDGTISAATLESLTKQGVDERDSLGLNRFRLVLVTADTDAILKSTASKFDSLSESDEKIHLHVVDVHEPSLIPLLM